MTEDELQEAAFAGDFIVKILPTGETGEIMGWNDVDGFLIDVGLPPCPTCNAPKSKQVWVPFAELEIIGEVEE